MAVMKGDTTCIDVLACIIYDINTVHNISTVSDNVKWNPVRKNVSSKIEKKTVNMKFHGLNIIHMYNFGVGSVDVAYQLHMHYIPYHWMPNSK